MTIDEYLRELGRRLRVGPLRRRRILREIEAHAIDAARQEEQGGCSRAEAERRATERLGSPEQLAGRFGGGRGSLHAALLAIALLAAAAFVVLLLGVALALSRGGGVRHATPVTATAVCGGKGAKRTCVDTFRRSCRSERARIQAAVSSAGDRGPVVCRAVFRIRPASRREG